MYKHILVTLDQSELAEQALGHAAAMAKAFGSTVHLVSVVRVVTRESAVSVELEAKVDSARDYMKGIRKRFIEQGIETEWDVCQGDVGEQILLYCEQQECDLVVMSTHGRSGVGRWVYGSIADRVLRYASVPVLLVRASETPEL